MKRVENNKPKVLAKYQDGVVKEYSFDTAISRLMGYYINQDIVEQEILAGRSLTTISAVYFAEDWKERRRNR